jgi:hypothetical protein
MQTLLRLFIVYAMQRSSPFNGVLCGVLKELNLWISQHLYAP